MLATDVARKSEATSGTDPNVKSRFCCVKSGLRLLRNVGWHSGGGMGRIWWALRWAFEWTRARTPFRHVSNLTRVRPPGWKSSPLAQFFEMMWNNQIATYATLGNAKRTQDLDLLLQLFANNLSKIEGKG